MSRRIYMTSTAILEEAIEAAPEAGLVDEASASIARKATAWAVYGYQRWRAEQERDEKIAAYEAIGADDDHLEAIRSSNRRAVEAGIL